MGVTNLWTILAPVRQHRPLSTLRDQTVAVDLSIWVCENQHVKSMHGVVTRPYLRNLFFRISHLTQLGVKLVFVIEGVAPQLKWREMGRRQQAAGRGRGRGGGAGKGVRSHFNAILRECCQLLDLLGIPYVQSQGEAEALCALLNSAGLVDACITDDGDVFLYGARTVYKNFTMNSKDPHVESYNMVDIERDLGLSRRSLVGVALLLGCDYLPGGVPGVGVDRVIKYIHSALDVDLIERFHKWKSISVDKCFNKLEMFIRQRALSVADFPQKEVIEEFLCSKEVVPKQSFVLRRPHLVKMQDYAEAKLEWPVEYSTEKVLPLLTLWDMNAIVHHILQDSRSYLKPNRIVKCRVRHSVPVFEVEWNKTEDDTRTVSEFYVTLEEQSLFRRAYPDVVERLEMESVAKEKQKPGSRKPRKIQPHKESLDSELLSQMTSLDLGDEKPIMSCEDHSTSTGKAILPIISRSEGSESCNSNLELCYSLDAKFGGKPTAKRGTTRKSSKMVMDQEALPIGAIKQESDNFTIPDPLGLSGRSPVEDDTPVKASSNKVEDEENEEVFLTLSQRLQLKLGQTSKVRCLSNGFEHCLALKRNQKTCKSETDVGLVSKNDARHDVRNSRMVECEDKLQTVSEVQDARQPSGRVMKEETKERSVKAEICEPGNQFKQGQNSSLNTHKPVGTAKKKETRSGTRRFKYEAPNDVLLMDSVPKQICTERTFREDVKVQGHATERTSCGGSENDTCSNFYEAVDAPRHNGLSSKDNIASASSKDKILFPKEESDHIPPASTLRTLLSAPFCDDPSSPSLQTSTLVCDTPSSLDNESPSPQRTTYPVCHPQSTIGARPVCMTPSAFSNTAQDATLEFGNFNIQSSLLSSPFEDSLRCKNLKQEPPNCTIEIESLKREQLDSILESFKQEPTETLKQEAQNLVLSDNLLLSFNEAVHSSAEEKADLPCEHVSTEPSFKSPSISDLKLEALLLDDFESDQCLSQPDTRSMEIAQSSDTKLAVNAKTRYPGTVVILPDKTGATALHTTLIVKRTSTDRKTLVQSPERLAPQCPSLVKMENDSRSIFPEMNKTTAGRSNGVRHLTNSQKSFKSKLSMKKTSRNTSVKTEDDANCTRNTKTTGTVLHLDSTDVIGGDKDILVDTCSLDVRDVGSKSVTGSSSVTGIDRLVTLGPLTSIQSCDNPGLGQTPMRNKIAPKFKRRNRKPCPSFYDDCDSDSIPEWDDNVYKALTGSAKENPPHEDSACSARKNTVSQSHIQFESNIDLHQDFTGNTKDSVLRQDCAQRYRGHILSLDLATTNGGSPLPQHFTGSTNSVRQDFTGSTNSVRQDFTGSTNSFRQHFTGSTNSVRQDFTGSTNAVRQDFGHDKMDNTVCEESVMEESRFDSPVSLSDRLKLRLSGNAKTALSVLTSKTKYAFNINIKPLK